MHAPLKNSSAIKQCRRARSCSVLWQKLNIVYPGNTAEGLHSSHRCSLIHVPRYEREHRMKPLVAAFLGLRLFTQLTQDSLSPSRYRHHPYLQPCSRGEKGASLPLLIFVAIISRKFVDPCHFWDLSVSALQQCLGDGLTKGKVKFKSRPILIVWFHPVVWIVYVILQQATFLRFMVARSNVRERW